jgi:hypothetical protein
VQCWYAQGAEHIKEWGKRVGLMEGQLTQLNEKLQARPMIACGSDGLPI